MKRRYRQHVNPLKMTSLVPMQEPLEIPAGPTVEVELGCGDARFIIERARIYPDRLFVGLDIREEFLDEGRELIAAEGLDNVTLRASNLFVDLPALFDPGRVHRFYVNFPDPWFKARQQNRRWFTAEARDHMVRALEGMGEILFQTDVWSVAIEALAVLEGSERLFNAAGAWSFQRGNPFEAQSTREELCAEEGRPVWRMLFVREPGNDDEEEPYD